MTEYITKERALEAFVRAMDFTDFEWDRVCEEMDFIPPEDVAPVVYAKWKFIAGPDEDNNVHVMCDNCGAGDTHALGVIVPYCWKCGARMDGGENDA